jgi:hypothetical protein
VFSPLHYAKYRGRLEEMRRKPRGVARFGSTAKLYLLNVMTAIATVIFLLAGS